MHGTKEDVQDPHSLESLESLEAVPSLFDEKTFKARFRIPLSLESWKFLNEALDISDAKLQSKDF